MSPELEGILSELRKNHDDKGLWAILADWLEDHERAGEAEGLRLLVLRLGKRPWRVPSPKRPAEAGRLWHWYGEDRLEDFSGLPEDRVDPASDLPIDVMERLGQWDGACYDWMIEYDDLLEAVLDAANAVLRALEEGVSREILER